MLEPTRGHYSQPGLLSEPSRHGGGRRWWAVPGPCPLPTVREKLVVQSTEGPAFLPHSKVLAQPGYSGCFPTPLLPTWAPIFHREFLGSKRMLLSLGSEWLESWGSSTGQVPWGSNDLGESLSDRKVEALWPATGRPHPGAPNGLWIRLIPPHGTSQAMHDSVSCSC